MTGKIDESQPDLENHRASVEPMRGLRTYLRLVPGALTISIVALSGLDSALNNRITVPATWLLCDAAIGVVALILHHRGRGHWAIALALFSNAASGSALMSLAETARSASNRRIILLGVVVLATITIRWHWPWTPTAAYHHEWWGIAFASVIVACLIAWGKYFGAHRALVESLKRHNATLEQTRQTEINAAQARVREHLAREMHDVLAHRLSLISMHSSALAHRQNMGDDDRKTGGAIINENARASLTELRSILSDLREPQPSGPQPDFSDLPMLVAKAQTQEFPIELKLDLPDHELPPAIGRHIFRIAQEGITNARKHGTPGPIVLRVINGATYLELTITNTADHHSAGTSGVGIKGITERVHLCGGHLVRTHEDHRHILNARIPLTETL